MRQSTNRGYSLLELMVAVAIVGVVAAIAYPSYQDYVTRGNRADGYSMVNEIMQAQERFFADQLTYTTDLRDLGYATAANVATDDGFYQISAAACGGGTIAQCVILTAAAQGAQAGDGNLTIDSRGTKTGEW